MNNIEMENNLLKKYNGDDLRVTIPKEVRTVDEMAFYGNNTIEELCFEEGILEIKRNAFSPCNALTTVTFPDSLESIGEFAFSCCRRLKNINFSDKLAKIERSAFSMCQSLMEVSLPENLGVLERGTFLGCRSLKKAIIKKKLQTIDVDAFSGCQSLLEFDVDPENPYIRDREGVLYSKDGKTLLLFPGGRLDIVVPDDVTEIGYHAFFENNNVDRLGFPENLKKIGDGSFFRCTELRSLKLPDGLEIIGSQVFEGCKNLRSMFIPDKVKKIGESTFRSCAALSWIRLPENLEFDIHWFCSLNDTGAFSADETVIPFISTRPISEIKSELGLSRAAGGFIRALLDGVEVKTEIFEGYLKYVKDHVQDYYEEIIKDEEKLRWFCDNKLVPEKDIEGLLTAASEGAAAGSGAILLEYQSKTGASPLKKEENQAAKDKLDERFSALENALDF